MWHSRVQLLIVGLDQISLGDLMEVHPSLEIFCSKEVSLGLDCAEVDLPNHLDSICGAVIGWNSCASGAVTCRCFLNL